MLNGCLDERMAHSMTARRAAGAVPCRLVISLLLLVACASPPERDDEPPVLPVLPDYAAPQGGIIDPAEVDRSDVISYRRLVRGDFKAENPPGERSQYASQLGAVTCAHIVTAPDLQLEIRSIRLPDGRTHYRATPLHLQFYAEMDRKCSWWNSDQAGLSERYVLEHEQVHFALFEIEARALNSSVREIEAEFDVVEESPEVAALIARKKLEGHLAASLEHVLARSREFDRSTSMGEHRERQSKWWDLVQSELSATADE
jgi:hypothetical protein